MLAPEPLGIDCQAEVSRVGHGEANRKDQPLELRSLELLRSHAQMQPKSIRDLVRKLAAAKCVRTLHGPNGSGHIAVDRAALRPHVGDGAEQCQTVLEPRPLRQQILDRLGKAEHDAAKMPSVPLAV
eukprot:9405925-Heterocapsa_arctica.AAC.1